MGSDSTNITDISINWMQYENEKIPHNCEHKSDKDDLYSMHPGDSILNVLARCFRGFFMCPHRNVRAVRLFRSHANIDFERSRHLRMYYYMIHPFSYFIILVECIMILTTLNYVCITLWLVSFPIALITEPTKSVLYYCVLVDELAATIFIGINFFTGIIRKETRQVELRFKVVVRSYLCGYFVIDAMGVMGNLIPHIWYLYMVEKFEDIPSYIRILVFVSNACRIIRMMTQIRHTTEVLKLSHQICVYTVWFFGVACYFHFGTCFSVFFAIEFDDGYSEGWINKAKVLDAEHLGHSYRKSIERTITEALGLCLRYPPSTLEDQITCMFFTWSGHLTFMVMLAKILQMAEANSSSALHYYAVITQVGQFMKSRRLPYRLRRRVLEFYDFRFQGSYFCEERIVKNISRQLRQDYSFHQCRRLVEKVSFFSDLPTHVLMRIVAVMRTEFYLHGETVIQLKALGTAMYFIKSGTVAVYSAFGQEVCHLEDGSHFGEIALVLARFRRVAQVVTIENCELYRLDRDEFNTVMAPFPEYLKRIRSTALVRLERMMMVESSHTATLGQNPSQMSKIAAATDVWKKTKHTKR